MPYSPINIKDLRELINKGEAKDPLVFLESIMNGQDPRKLSSLYELIIEIDEFNGGDIPRSDWNEIVDMAISNFKFHNVSLSESVSASKTLAEYLHAKRKQVDISSSNTDSNNVNVPLTEEEIELFREKFNEDF